MFFPEMMAARIKKSALYALFCLFSFGGILYVGKRAWVQMIARIEAGSQLADARSSLVDYERTQDYLREQAAAGERAVPVLIPELTTEVERVLAHDKSYAPGPLKSAIQQASDHYETAVFRMYLFLMAWTLLLAVWLVLVGAYFEESYFTEEYSFQRIASNVWLTALFGACVGFLVSFVAAFGPIIWNWLFLRIAGYTVGAWLLTAVALALTGAATYYDFFRSKPETFS